MRRLSASVFVALVALASAPCKAQAEAPFAELPFASVVRRHYYDRLEKRPLRALGYELALPGAGNYYVGLYLPAACTLVLSVTGASMWVAGARRDDPALAYLGVGVFAAARAYGLVSAPIGAALLNAAFRRQLGLTRPF
jgi:hypothetical protein